MNIFSLHFSRHERKGNRPFLSPPPDPRDPVKHARHVQSPESESPVRVALGGVPRRPAHQKADEPGAVDIRIISIRHAPLQKLGAASRRHGGRKRRAGGGRHDGAAPQGSGRGGKIHAGGRKLRLDPAVQGKATAGIYIKAVVPAVIGGHAQNVLCIGGRGQGGIRIGAQELHASLHELPDGKPHLKRAVARRLLHQPEGPDACRGLLQTDHRHLASGRRIV